MKKTNENLKKFRIQIDVLDRKISTLIGKRFKVAEAIGKEKKKNKIKIENKNREGIVLRRIKTSVKGNKQKKAVSNIYKEIIKQTKILEK